MKKILLFFIIMMTVSLVFAAGGVDLRNVLTEEGYNKAIADNNAADISDVLKEWNLAYIELGKAFRNANLNGISYAEAKSKVAGTKAGVVDAFFSNFLFQNEKVMAGYFADTSYNDPEVNYRKFVILPGRVPKNVAKATNANTYISVVLKGATSTYSSRNESMAYFRIAVIRMLDRTDELPRDRALSILKDLKRTIYKNITKGDDWKQLLTDLEIKIQALQ